MSGIKRVFGGIKVSLWIKCKGATELASRAMDENLPLSARFALKLHHLVCANCARCAVQLNEIRRLLQHEPAAGKDDVITLSPEAAHRIETELQKKLKS